MTGRDSPEFSNDLGLQSPGNAAEDTAAKKAGEYMDVLGIIGGLGPMATAVFIKKIIAMTDAKKDQEHIPILIAHYPSIPDRTSYILGRSDENPLPALIDAGALLKNAGVKSIAIPCVTAHYFMPKMRKKVSIPIMDGVRETAEYLKENGFKNVGIMCTDGTRMSKIFNHEFKPFEIECIYPSDEGQQDVMSIIYDYVKAGEAVPRELFDRVSGELQESGAEIIILGCTELSVAADEYLPDGLFLDVLDVMARKCVSEYGKLKREYKNIIREV